MLERFEGVVENLIEDAITIKVKCSKGTYIRSLCEDISTKLGTVGTMQNLMRTIVDEFKIEESISIDEVKEKEISYIESKFISIEQAFSKIPEIMLDTKRTKHFLNGVKITQNNIDGVYRIYENNEFLGLGLIENKLLKRDVIIDNS